MISADELQEGEMLTYDWHDAHGAVIAGDTFAPKAYKTYELLAPNLTHAITRADGSYHFTIKAEKLALFVAVESDLSGRFSQNAFTVFPGHTAHVTFAPTQPGPTPRFTIRDLHSATYGSQ